MKTQDMLPLVLAALVGSGAGVAFVCATDDEIRAYFDAHGLALGGPLDMQGHDVVDAGRVNGRDVAADGARLDAVSVAIDHLATQTGVPVGARLVATSWVHGGRVWPFVNLGGDLGLVIAFDEPVRVPTDALNIVYQLQVPSVGRQMGTTSLGSVAWRTLELPMVPVRVTQVEQPGGEFVVVAAEIERDAATATGLALVLEAAQVRDLESLRTDRCRVIVECSALRDTVGRPVRSAAGERFVSWFVVDREERPERRTWP